MISRKTDFQLHIVNKIKKLRQENNISQAQICDILSLSSVGQIGNIESPKFSQKYTLEQLYMLTTYFNYPLERLFLTEEELAQSTSQIINSFILKLIAYK